MPEAIHCTIGLDERIIYFGLDLGFPLHTFACDRKNFLFRGIWSLGTIFGVNGAKIINFGEKSR